MAEKTDSLAYSDSELAQCEAEVGTLLQIISELNVKMGALQIPRDLKDDEAEGQACTLILDTSISTPDSQTSPVAHAGMGSAESVITQGGSEPQGGSGELWTKLHEVLSALESSVSRGRELVSPHILDDGKTQVAHITAARESWVEATQVLEEMERELGITYPSALPDEERQNYQKEVLLLDKLNRELRSSLQSQQEKQKNAEGTILVMEEEKKRLNEKLNELKSKWLIAASCSPPRSPSLSSNRTSSPCLASPVLPGSPLSSHRRPVSPAASPFRPSRPSSGSSGMETETEHLQRCLERLKVRNERLTTALERRKSELEQVSMALSRHEANCSALHMALAYCEECEEAYSDLLSLYEVTKGQNATLPEPSASEQPDSLIIACDESSYTSVSTDVKQNRLSAEEFEDKTGVILQRISRLKQDRAAVCIPEEMRTGEGKLSPDTGTLAGARRFNNVTSNNPKREKAALLYELVNVREEMSELRGFIRLKEKERQCLDYSLIAQKFQDLAGAAMAQSLREELDDKRAEQQRIDENRAKLESGGGIPGPRNRAIMRELQATLQRERVLKRRVTSSRESLDLALSDCTTQSRLNKEEVTRLSLCHSKAISTCRGARKKHYEQLKKLEQQMTNLQECHATQLAELKAKLDTLEWKKEETVL